ncbi:Hypothetical predicted protein [Mytilus galloprovincialis]|uniref:Mutator-like transposase domain-containing protein n=1 Tax=Mytilus galloprovincialis TaxID=29158 RepID=A0A8B6FJG7_MYTGA|nr:Hypothetical predicted protein [Mytilus galloprovincialis]
MARFKGRFVRQQEKDRRVQLSELVSDRNVADHTKNTEATDTYQSIWLPGERRIFEPYQVSKDLKAGCTDCGSTLHITDIVTKTNCGLGFIITNEETENVPIKIKYDMGWQKRGSGRKYDSMSGVGVAIGNETGKVLEREIRSKNCRTCSYWEGKGIEAAHHDCPRNWYGTSKGMEPDVGVSLIKKLEEKKCTVSTLIMDDDATTMSKIQKFRQNIDHDITKWSDIKHVQNSLGKKLYVLPTSYRKSIRNDDIAHLMKCFTYAVHSNKNNKQQMQNDLSAIVPHVFNEHDHCNVRWCRYLKNPEKYTPTIQLSNLDLKSKLSKIFQDYVENIDKLVPCASTKENESFNNMLTAKAPKNKHYSASTSLEARVNCTVAQKNESFNYVSIVNVECGLSPGKVTENSSNQLIRKRKLHSSYCNSKEFKKKKLDKKRLARNENNVLEIREGDTYKTEIDMLCQNMQETDVISNPLIIEELTQVQNIQPSIPCVYFDLETTSLSLNCDIVQISAVNDMNVFDQYITPSSGISKYASEVTGLSMCNNILCYNGRKVNSCSPQQGLQNFIIWLQETIPEKCMLIAHNAKIFDAGHQD